MTAPRPALYAPLHLAAGPSRLLTWGVVAVHGAALPAALTLPLHWAVRLLLAATLLVAAARALRVQALRLDPTAICAAEWDEQGVWTLRLRSGAALEGRLTPDSLAGPWLTVLNFRTGRWGRRSLVLTRDNCDPGQLRRLRVRLRLGRAGVGA